MIKNMNKKNDDILTFIQVICAFSVITLHTNGCFWKFDNHAGYWPSANIIECLFYFAVPNFFMLTGITLIDYQEKYSTKIFFEKRVKKTLFPYIVWCSIGILYNLHVGYFNYESIGIRTLLNEILTGQGIISVYWFFPCLFCVYLSVPLFAGVDKYKKNIIFKYIIFIGIVFNIFIPFINKIFELQLTWQYTISVASGYILWAVIGYEIYRHPIKKWQEIIICLACVAGFIMHAYGTYTLSFRDGAINDTFKGYNNLPCLMYSTGVFIILCKMAKKIMRREICKKIINFIGKFTFPIYLMHWFVIDLLLRHFNFDTTSLLWRIGAPIPIGLFIVGITWLLRKLPVLKEIVP